ncbi:MAG: PBP1A family penicillin-binding protein [Deltaproteobacteria bacterium]|nr:PBP1A family penicillin-binding protein [Deltaproteobacteria bacterium]
MVKRPGSAKRILVLLGLLFFLHAVPAAAVQEKMETYPPFTPDYSSIKVFDSQSRFVGRILPEKRYWVTIDHIPVFLQNALVAIEDARFYQHRGIDVRGITRALVKDVIKGRMAEGGSTITQQLIKNKYFSNEKTIQRKLKEGILAVEYEGKYTKKQILEMYFNEVYFGNGAWGLVQAARLYFDKNPPELTEAECALLAGIPKAPTRYNPLTNFPAARDRKNLILKRMAELKMITPGRAKRLTAQRIIFLRSDEAPYYLSHIRSKLSERYGSEIIELGGLDVIAAMDLDLQRLAQRVLKEGVRKVSSELQGALVSLDPSTGDVLAAVGGTDFKQSPYNRAFFAKRQPGSAVKPLIYAAALDKGIKAGSMWNDDPVSYIRGNNETWKPRNYGNRHYGSLSLRQALAYSNNVITVKLLEDIGVRDFVAFAGNLGLPLREPNDLSLALGTDEVTLIELMLAYCPLATGGERPEPRTMMRIYDRGRSLWTEIPPAIAPVLSPAVAYVTTSMLKDVLIYGTAKSLRGFSQVHPAAGKTGTTDDYRDAWFIGYTPRMITGVWTGYDKPTPMGAGFTGGAICAPVWEQFMRTALADKAAPDFAKPDSVVSVLIDPETGDLAAPGCPTKREEFYIAGTEPTVYCPNHAKADLPPPAGAPSAPPDQP